ncbi:MAG TPA: hypothetical protein VG734_17875 [Lacunisphaera sp.]|nr:hypothetical protein [Lacunisphaera sp.]
METDAHQLHDPGSGLESAEFAATSRDRPAQGPTLHSDREEPAFNQPKFGDRKPGSRHPIFTRSL